MSNSPMPTSRYIFSLDILRAAAAFLVLFFHLNTIFITKAGLAPFNNFFSKGAHGIDLFFVLSGFIIMRAHSRDIGRPERLINYLFNRISRIFPSLWIMTLLATSVYAVGFDNVEKSAKLTLINVVESYLLLPQSGPALLNVSWTLKYEMFFYIVFGLLIISKHIGILLFFIWQVAIFVTYLLPDSITSCLEYFYLRPLSFEFTIGIACAGLLEASPLRKHTQSALRQWSIVVTGGGIFILGLVPWSQIDDGTCGMLCAAGSGLLIIGLVMLERAGRLKVPALLIMLGGASYSIYLVHYSIMSLLAILLIHMHIPLNSIVLTLVAAAGICSGCLFDRMVDRPIQLLLRSRVKPILLGPVSL